jgi:dephospho-CoA kinase
MKEDSKIIVVAITGGIGCGKSAVAEIIKNMGYIVISSDENAKTVMVSNEKVRRKLISEFGEDIYFDDGKLNKDWLSKIVFGDSLDNEKSLAKLNSIVHPAVIEKLIEDVEYYEKSGEKIVFVESALTFEAQLEEGFDYIIVVDAKEKVIFERLKRSRNLSEEEIRFRMRQQLSQELKKQHADFVIENNGSLDELKKSVEIIVNILSRLVK